MWSLAFSDSMVPVDLFIHDFIALTYAIFVSTEFDAYDLTIENVVFEKDHEYFTSIDQ